MPLSCAKTRASKRQKVEPLQAGLQVAGQARAKRQVSDLPPAHIPASCLHFDVSSPCARSAAEAQGSPVCSLPRRAGGSRAQEMPHPGTEGVSTTQRCAHSSLEAIQAEILIKFHVPGRHLHSQYRSLKLFTLLFPSYIAKPTLQMKKIRGSFSQVLPFNEEGWGSCAPSNYPPPPVLRQLT